MRISSSTYVLFWFLIASETFAQDVSQSLACQEALVNAPEKVESICLPVLSMDESDATATDKTYAYLNLATVASLEGLYAKADNYLAQALAANPLLSENNKLRFNWLRKKALNYYKQDRFEDALPHMREALGVAEYLYLESAMATSFNDLGATYMELGDFSHALQYFERALEYLQKGDRKDSIAITQSNIGIIYRELQQYDFATNYFTRALETMEEHASENQDDKISLRQIPHIYENRGIAFFKAKEFDQAGNDLTRSLALYQTHGFVPEQVRVYAAIAELSLAQNNTASAKEALDSALALQQANDWQSLELLLALTTYYTEMKDYADAINLARQGKALADDKKRFEYQLRFLKKLGELYRFQGLLTQSLDYLDQYMILYKSYLEQKYSPRVADLQSVIEVQQQQQEIHALEFAQQQSLSKIKQQQIILILAGAVIILVFTVFYVLYRKRKRESAFLNREINFHKAELARLTQAEEALATEPESENNGNSDSFDVLLVSLMRDCLDVWGNVTGKGNIELAEESNIWTVVVDDGRLRTRTMEKYLHIDKLPKSPRWRQVVRTCRYILINCDLNNAQRDKLNNELEKLLAVQKEQALASRNKSSSS